MAKLILHQKTILFQLNVWALYRKSRVSLWGVHIHSVLWQKGVHYK